MTKTFVIVGASTGLGRAAARVLSRRHRVIVAGRDVAQLRIAVPRAEAMRVDLADLADVARFAGALPQRIDGLICNAGVQATGAPVFTRDGIEETFAVNHLAHLAIATRLAGQLGRVVFIGSGTHDPNDRVARVFGFRGARYTNVDRLAAGDGDPAVDDAQRARDRYATSKLCNLLATFALVQRGTDAIAFDPGLMPGTGLARERGVLARFGWHTVMRAVALIAPGASSARRSGRALAWLAADYTGPARYLDYRRREVTRSSDALRPELAGELYASSLALIDRALARPFVRAQAAPAM